MLIAIVIGFLFGFVGSIPVAGPLAVVIFARGLDNRVRSAVFVAIGGAVGETIYAFLAFYGFARVLEHWPEVVPISRAVAALILVGLGLVFLLRKDGGEATSGASSDRRRHGFALGLTLTALNPTLLATWTAAATTLFSTGWVASDRSLALPFALAACAGIVGWFLLLLGLVRRYRERFRRETLHQILRVMGVVLIGIGLYFGWLFARWLGAG